MGIVRFAVKAVIGTVTAGPVGLGAAVISELAQGALEHDGDYEASRVLGLGLSAVDGAIEPDDSADCADSSAESTE